MGDNSPVTQTRIAEFEVGRPTEGTFAVLSKARRMNRNGDPYLTLELSDASGTIAARVWDNADYFDRHIQPGDKVLAVGKPTKFRDELQFEIRRLDRVDNPIEESFIPAAGRPLDELHGELEFLVGEIIDDVLRETAVQIWNGPDSPSLLKSPATISEHHSYLGGLVEHTVSVATICMAAADRHPQVDRSLLLTAALVHDVGRAREIRIGETLEADADAQLYGHILLGHEMISEAARGTGADKLPNWPGLVHAVAQHHGPVDRCRTREAAILATANSLDIRLSSPLRR